MADKNTKTEEEEAEKEIPNLTSRKCRKCGKYLTKARYYDCEDCTPRLKKDIEDDSIYFY